MSKRATAALASSAFCGCPCAALLSSGRRCFLLCFGGCSLCCLLLLFLVSAVLLFCLGRRRCFVRGVGWLLGLVAFCLSSLAVVGLVRFGAVRASGFGRFCCLRSFRGCLGCRRGRCRRRGRRGLWPLRWFGVLASVALLLLCRFRRLLCFVRLLRWGCCRCLRVLSSVAGLTGVSLAGLFGRCLGEFWAAGRRCFGGVVPLL